MKISITVLSIGLLFTGCSRGPDQAGTPVIENHAQLISWWKATRKSSPSIYSSASSHSLLYRILSYCTDDPAPVTLAKIRMAITGTPQSDAPAAVSDSTPGKSPKKPYRPSTNWDAARAALDLSPLGTTRVDGEPALLLKNMKTVKKGDTISAVYENLRYEWRVTSVANGIVELTPATDQNRE